MNPRGLILSVGILLLFLAVFVPLARRINSGRDRSIDTERLRRTYVALALYETEQGGPASNLGLVRRDVDPSDLQSVGDPEVGHPGFSGFSYDAALPKLRFRSETRVSWSYRRQWPGVGSSPLLDRRQGLLADPWLGSVLCLNVDGSLIERPHADELTFEKLFGR